MDKNKRSVGIGDWWVKTGVQRLSTEKRKWNQRNFLPSLATSLTSIYLRNNTAHKPATRTIKRVPRAVVTWLLSGVWSFFRRNNNILIHKGAFAVLLHCNVFLGLSPVKSCLMPVGVEDGRIPDEAFTASSSASSNYLPNRARLNLLPNGGKYCWAAKDNNINQWLQVWNICFSVCSLRSSLSFNSFFTVRVVWCFYFFVTITHIGCVPLVKIQIRISNPKMDFLFLWANPREDFESIEPTLLKDSIDSIQIRICWIWNPSVPLGTESKEVLMVSGVKQITLFLISCPSF